MELLDVALQIIAIIAIVAVGAFIIVFLSDLLISIIDDHQGIFFKRNRGKNEEKNNVRSYQNENSYYNEPQKLEERTAFGLDYDFEETQKVVQPTPTTIKKNTVDLEQAAKEQEMIERANKNFFDEEVEEKDNTPVDIAEKERLAALEERNKQLEKELNEVKEKKEPIKFNDLNNAFSDEDIDEDEVEETEESENIDMDEYEKLIKDINQEVLKDFEQSKNPNTVAPKAAFVDMMDDLEDDEEDEEMSIEEEIAHQEEIEENEEVEESKTSEIQQKDDSKYTSLEEELRTLKEQLEEERKVREQLKLEADEKAQKLVEEKLALEEALRVKAEQPIVAPIKVLGSEDEYLERLALLEERLKEAKKQLRKNKREFVPLNKIKRTLEKDQIKLRRKEAQVAKQKVALFGINNSEIDPIKQEELEQEIDMLEGLKLSVQHCEDVMHENADRYPVLEQTHSILSKNVKNLESDIKIVEEKLAEIRKKKA